MNHETLRLWGTLPIIKEYKSKQDSEQLSDFRQEWFHKVDQAFEELQKQNTLIDSARVYERLGVRRNVLVRKFPEVTKYVADRLRQIRHQEQEEKLKGYILAAREAAARKIQEGVAYTQADIAAEVGLSLSGFQRYPELVDVWRVKLN